MPIDFVALAGHIDRVRRVWATWRPGLVVRDVPGGWVAVQTGAPAAEFPSQGKSRVNWLAPDGPVGETAVARALDAARELECPRIFLWLAPWGCDVGTEAALRRAGAVPMQDVDQIAVGCETDGGEARAAAGAPVGALFEARRLAPGEIAEVMERVRPWYGPDGAGIAARFTKPGRVEIFGAFEGEAPVAIALLMIDGEWAYLGGAGTDPTKRGRGAQTALIRTRVQRGADLGVRWCAAETNTAVATSFRNLRRCGFQDVLVWRVWRWDNNGARG